MPSFVENIKKFDDSLPAKVLSGVMIGIGITFILVGVFSKSNVLKATMITYAVAP